jgi:hypothetical protein
MTRDTLKFSLSATLRYLLAVLSAKLCSRVHVRYSGLTFKVDVRSRWCVPVYALIYFLLVLSFSTDQIYSRSIKIYFEAQEGASKRKNALRSLEFREMYVVRTPQSVRVK